MNWAGGDGDELHQELIELLEAARLKGLVRPLPPQLLLALSWGPLTELARSARLRAERPPEAELHALAGAVWAALRAEERAVAPA